MCLCIQGKFTHQQEKNSYILNCTKILPVVKRKYYCHGIRRDCVFLPKYTDSFALKIRMPVSLLSLCMFHARFCCRSSWTVFISYFPQGSICWMFSHTKDHVWIFCCVVVRSSNKESKSCILREDFFFFFWDEKCVLNTQIVSSSQVLIFQ